MKPKTARTFGVLIFLALILTPCAWPQASTGRVSGTVRDQSGAVIPDVPVVMTNTGTNVSSTTKTNDVGFYFFPGVTTGQYRVVVEAPGMEKLKLSSPWQ